MSDDLFFDWKKHQSVSGPYQTTLTYRDFTISANISGIYIDGPLNIKDEENLEALARAIGKAWEDHLAIVKYSMKNLASGGVN